MRIITLALVLFSASVQAQTVSSPVTFAWNPSVDPVLGYRLYLDGGSPSTVMQTETAPIAMLPGPHTAVVSAFNANGESEKLPMPPLSFFVQVPVDPACAPLGNRAVSIFVTTLQRLGTGGGALTVARLDFQLASPNSPVTRAAVRTNGADLAAVDGTSLTALAGLWFPVPAAKGTYVLSVFAQNAYGCTNEVLTTKSVTVK